MATLPTPGGDNNTWGDELNTWLQAGGSGQGPWINAKHPAYGAVGDDVNDDTAEIQAALNALPAAGGVVFLPAGTYKISSSLDLGLKKSLVGEGWETTTIHYTGSAHAINIGDPAAVTAPAAALNRLANLAINGPGASTVGSIGVRVTKSLFPHVENVKVSNSETGFRIDGGDLWIASGKIIGPRTTAVKFGMLITADSGKQVNDMTILGGYIYGGGGESNAYGIKVEASSDTNRFIGASVEGFGGTGSKGFWVTSGASFGHNFIATRSEGCTTHFLLDSGATNHVVIGHNQEVTDNGFANKVTGVVNRVTWRFKSAASFTPDAAAHESHHVDTLTGPITISNPTGAARGKRLTFIFRQDATGGRVITWGSEFKLGTALPTTANTRNTITFERTVDDLWVEVARSTGVAI